MKKNRNKALNMSRFPEEITEEGLQIYGETSYENQIALLSHYLHNNQEEVSDDKKEEIILAIREFLSRKQFRQEKNGKLSDEQIWMTAEHPMQYNLFDEFFNVPFPAPENPHFTFIDLFAGIGGFRIAFQNLSGKCIYSHTKKVA